MNISNTNRFFISNSEQALRRTFRQVDGNTCCLEVPNDGVLATINQTEECKHICMTSSHRNPRILFTLVEIVINSIISPELQGGGIFEMKEKCN